MKPSLLPLLSLSLLAAAAAPGTAQTAPTDAPPAAAPAETVPAAPSTDTEARKAIANSIEAYKKLNGLSMAITLTDTQGEEQTVLTGTFDYSKPYKAKLTFKGEGGDPVLNLQDGKVFVSQSNKKNYISDPYPNPKSAARVWDGVPSFGGSFVAEILAGQNPFEKPPFKGAKLSLASAEGVDSITGPLALSPTVTAQLKVGIGQEDHLLRSFSVSLEMRGQKFANTTAFSDIKVNPTFVTGTFTFKPASGLKKLTAEEANAYWDPSLKKGAVPFAISATDTSGKPQTLAKYKGKVLLVDFWATWCGPCIGELPNVQAAYKKYHGKGFEILAISLDEKKEDLTNFVKAQKMPWPQIYSGKGWKDPLVEKYGVKGIPFTMLVGKDGKIVDVNLRGEALDAAVKKALAAK